MYSRNIKLPEVGSVLLLGPRGTGKTTWVKQCYPNALYLDLLNAEIYNPLLANPQRIEQMILPEHGGVIIIDEIQQIPQLLNEVHRLIESRHYQFVMTGSSARKLRRGGANLLAGRALTYEMHPLTAPEMGEEFDWVMALQRGLLPQAWEARDPQRYLASYVKTYLESEVRQEGLTRNLSAFARFLEIVSFSQGSLLNTSEVGREAMVGRKAVENYVSIVEDLLIARQLPIFTYRAKRKLVNHRKFYFFDVGIFRAIRPTGYLNSPGEIEGAAAETLVWQNLEGVNANLELGYKTYFWRTQNGVEVDFVLYGERGLLAFEVKLAQRWGGDDCRGLEAFRQDYPEAKCYLLYGGEREMNHGGIRVLPIRQALLDLPKILANA